MKRGQQHSYESPYCPCYASLDLDEKRTATSFISHSYMKIKLLDLDEKRTATLHMQVDPQNQFR